MQFLQFSTVYLLLLLILFIMKRCRIEKTGLLLMASAKMTIQLILSGWVLTYLFDRPNSLWTGLYLFVMMAFPSTASYPKIRAFLLLSVL